MAITQLGYHETLVNNFQDQITAAINDTATSISVPDATGLPTQGFFRGEIDDELILFDGRTGNTLNVATNGRGIEGTTAASHLINAEIKIKLTAGGFQRFMLDHFAGAFSEDAVLFRSTPLNRFHDINNDVLQVSDFTWFNQGSATATDLNGAIYMTIPDEANDNLRGIVVNAPSTPWRALVKVNAGIGMGLMDNTGTHCGLVARESSTGKLTTASIRYGGRLAFWNWDSPTSFNGIVDTNQDCHEDGIWIRMDDDGTNLSMRVSNKVGLGFSQTADAAWWQQGRTAHMAGGANQIGIYLNSGTNSGNNGAGPCVCHVTFEAFWLQEL